jgi:hypothetical protein
MLPLWSTRTRLRQAAVNHLGKVHHDQSVFLIPAAIAGERALQALVLGRRATEPAKTSFEFGREIMDEC